MTSDLIRVKRPSWVRIVNPEPFTLMGRTYSYGERLMTRPGGKFRVLLHDGFMSLAAYEAPHPPITDKDCPSMALLFRPHMEYQLLAEGKLEDEADPHDRPLRDNEARPAQSPVFPGHRARVPKSRSVRAVPPMIASLVIMGGAYRQQLGQRIDRVRRSVRSYIRPGGTLTVIESRSPRVRVLYRAVPGNADQHENDTWFWMSEAEFCRMEREYLELRRLEESERQEIHRLLRSL